MWAEVCVHVCVIVHSNHYWWGYGQGGSPCLATDIPDRFVPAGDVLYGVVFYETRVSVCASDKDVSKTVKTKVKTEEQEAQIQVLY